MIVLGLSLGLMLAAGACLARATGSPDESRATGAVRLAIWAFALLIVVEAALGACGRLGARATLLALGLAAFAALAIARSTRGLVRPSREAPRAPLATVDVALLSALAAALVLRLWAGFDKTVFLYDTLSYHLHTPATWLAERRLTIVPAVFGDPSPAYAPSNLELWFAFLMAPLHSDYLAGSGQIAFAALGVLAVVAAVREGGGSRTAALGAGLAFFWIPEIWQQARTAMSDLGMAALLLATLPFLDRLRKRPNDGDLLTAAAALGLAIGTKYVAALMAMPFAVAMVAVLVKQRRARPRVLAAAAAVVMATGGFWYARNAWLTGNPFYPVASFGLPGLYDRAAMRAWIYHLPTTDLRALAAIWIAAGKGFCLAVATALLCSRGALEKWLLAGLTALFWFAVPYQESRFLFAAFGVAAVVIGLGIARATTVPGRYAVVITLGAALLEGAGGELPPVPERFWATLAAVVGLAADLLWDRVPARARRSTAVAAIVLATAAGAAALTRGLRDYRARDPGYGIGTGIDDTWAWFRANVQGTRVAYTGTNLAFPLTGRELANHVSYVNVAGKPGDRLHDFGRRTAPPGRAATPEPAPYRDGAGFDTWLRNLRAAGAEVLFVAALDEIVARNVAADGDRFPVERAWADAHPELFRLRYESPDARVYGIAP
jgi:4-amino-4-deoxy-L-arabinose transferase-like glycosyltransferase